MLQLLSPPLHLPRARVEPISTAVDALGVVSLAISRPLREELVIIICDRRLRGLSITVFDCAPSPIATAHAVVGHVSATPGATGVIATHVAPTDSLLQSVLGQCLMRADLRLEYFFHVSRGRVSSVAQ